MKTCFIAPVLIGFCIQSHAQFAVTSHQEGWNNIPPEAQKPGFAFQKSILADMDGDGIQEEVMLFGHDNGHWPEFDLFKAYYAIVDNYSKDVKYISDEILTDHYDLNVEDRNNDGISELYITYIKDGKFRTNEEGYNLQAIRCYDRIEWNPDSKKTTGKNTNKSGRR